MARILAEVVTAGRVMTDEYCVSLHWYFYSQSPWSSSSSRNLQFPRDEIKNQMLQQQQKKPQYWIGCLVICAGSSMEKWTILARGLKFQLGHLIIDLWNWQFEGTGVAWHLQDWVDFVGGSQPLVSLLPVARDSGEQRAGLMLDALLVDEELLHAAVDRVDEEIGHPQRASQGILLGSLCACVREKWEVA